MKLFLACFGALVLGMGLPVRAAATIEHTDVRYENGFLTIVFSNADAQANLYALEASADLVGFADTERLGFQSQMDYQGTELGEYEFTIRVFEHGYLTRVIVGDRGVFVTTDEMARDRFEELAAAMRGVLREVDGE
ncbi:MAG: DUF7522 family protein [Verrucomicrobiota bacterium]